ncbi:MAG: HAD family hydrolase [Candidatus Thorarchaeota archaeon]|jgi:HAD superfamily hydrolase (TIGR01549 family)
MGDKRSKLSGTKAILLDMHETITEVNEGIMDLTRKISQSAGIDLSKFSDEEIQEALEKVVEWFNPYQIENDVDIHFGNKVEHWTDANRVMFEALGFEGLSDEVLNSVEVAWKEKLETWESLRPDAKTTLEELHGREYQLGICTRRPDDPTDILKKFGIHNILSTVQWSSVPGYAKPHPFTLILAADEIGVNPRRCAFVGNRVDADIVAAQRSGMQPILTTWADPDEAKKAPEGTLIIGEVSELLDLFV